MDLCSGSPHTNNYSNSSERSQVFEEISSELSDILEKSFEIEKQLSKIEQNHSNFRIYQEKKQNKKRNQTVTMQKSYKTISRFSTPSQKTFTSKKKESNYKYNSTKSMNKNKKNTASPSPIRKISKFSSSTPKEKSYTFSSSLNSINTQSSKYIPSQKTKRYQDSKSSYLNIEKGKTSNDALTQVLESLNSIHKEIVQLSKNQKDLKLEFQNFKNIIQKND